MDSKAEGFAVKVDGDGITFAVRQMDGFQNIPFVAKDITRYSPEAWRAVGAALWEGFDGYVQGGRALMLQRYAGPKEGLNDELIADMIGRRAPLIMASTVQPDTFAGLDLRATPMAAYDLLELWPGIRYINQAAFNFLTLKDIDGPVHRALSLKKEGGIDANSLTSEVVQYKEGEKTHSDDAADMIAKVLARLHEAWESRRLMSAFESALIAEAAPHVARVVTGCFVLERVPFPQLDDYIEYDSLRIVLTPRGMAVSIVYRNELGAFYLAFWYAPDAPPVLIEPVLYPMMSVICAGIWRDACIVREKWYTEKRRQRQSKTTARRLAKDTALILPRQISHIGWASDSEREHIARNMHAVRGHYRRLAEGWSRHDTALELAEKYGYPAPPDGYTFVIPHSRGNGDPAASAVAPARRVVCRGLYAVKVSLA